MKNLDTTKPARVPVIHKKCGGQCGWYLRDSYRPMKVALSCDYERMDGTKPEYGSIFIEKCHACGERIRSHQEMNIVFKEGG